MLETDNLFYQLALVLFIAAGVGGLARLLHQPLIVAFIVVGIIVGPTWLHVIEDEETWDLLATTGVALLLFLVGLKLDMQVIRKTGLVALASGIGQVAFTAAVGFAIAIGLGLSPVGALYVAVALTFSSTIIIIKLLSDKQEIDSLHGRVAVGLLIVQDIIVVLVMIGLSSFGAGTTEADPWQDAVNVLIRGALFLVVLVLLARFVLPRLFNFFARSQEMLVLGAIGWAIIAAAAGDALGFSKEVGAFLAGVSVASTPFRESLSSRLTSVRDFLLLFFFLTLGAGLDLSLIGRQIGPAIIFSLFVLIGNPIIVMAIMRFMGFRKRTGFLTGLTVAQISEFSLIMAALGLTLGHIDNETMALITLVGLITIGASTYLILYSHHIYGWIAPLLDVFESPNPYQELQEEGKTPEDVDVLAFGSGRYGGEIVRALADRGIKVLAVDFDPQAIRLLKDEGIPAVYGDAEDPDFIPALPLGSAKWVLSTVPLLEANVVLVRCLRANGFQGGLAVRSHDRTETTILRREGVHVILDLFVDAAYEAADELEQELRRTPGSVGPSGERHGVNQS